MMAGTWSNSRRSHSSFMSIIDLLGQAKVGIGEDGELVVPVATGLNGQPRRWVEVAPFVWHDLNSHERLAAVVQDGRVVRWSLDGFSPFMVFDRVPGSHSSAWLLPSLIAALAILAITALFWPVRAIVRRRFGATLPFEKRELWAYRASRIAALAILLVLVGWAYALSAMMSDFTKLSSAFDPMIVTLQLLSLVIFPGGLAAMLWFAWTAWRAKRGWKPKVWSLALVFAASIVAWIGFAFHLVGFGTNY
jgi:hypothetical protein